MPPEFLAPGVFIREIPMLRTIDSVATSVAAFVGRTRAGPADTATLVTSFAEFESRYGALADDLPLSHAVRQYFENGGANCYIARVVHRKADGSPDEAAAITDADVSSASLAAAGRGLWLLDRVDLVNLVCIPPLAPGVDVGRASWEAAIGWARRHRAFVIVDAPAAWKSAAAAVAGIGSLIPRDPNAAVYFPRLMVAGSRRASRLQPSAACGAIAGVYARTDETRGVWKAPAGIEARLAGVSGLETAINGPDNALLNGVAINALRTFPGHGPVVWGARTLAGNDGSGSEWKYVSVRRLALHIEESIDRGTRCAVFESNDRDLWSQLRSSVESFMDGLFRAGAFQGSTSREAYFVRCGLDTTSQAELASGIVNLIVGFAAARPAEFLLLRLAVRAASGA